MLVLELLKEMKADGNPPTEVAFKAAVDCCSKVSVPVESKANTLCLIGIWKQYRLR